MTKNNKKYVSWLNLSVLATMIPVSTGVGLAIGYYLDKLFSTKPYLTIVFTIFGIIAGFKNIIEFLNREEKKVEKNSSKNLHNSSN